MRIVSKLARAHLLIVDAAAIGVKDIASACLCTYYVVHRPIQHFFLPFVIVDQEVRSAIISLILRLIL